MKKRKSIEGNIDEIVAIMRQCKDLSEYRRVQWVYLAIFHPEITTKEIAEKTLFTTRTVNLILASYIKEGLAGLSDNRGGADTDKI